MEERALEERTLEARIENLEQVMGFVDGVLERLDCPMKAQVQLDVAVEELFVNVAHYAYAPGVGAVTLRIEAFRDPLAVEITFIDGGKPFNPLDRADPDVTLPAEARKIGGLGIYMARKSVDTMRYRYADGKNILTIRKVLS